MPDIISIRQLYKPVQPAVKHSSGTVVYSESLPEERLQPFIYCYWELRSLPALRETFLYRVAADGCIDLFFDRNNPSENLIMGFSKAHTEFPLSAPFHYIGIRFLPGMLPLIFRLNASVLSNRIEHLETVLPAVSAFIKNQAGDQISFDKTRDLFDAFLLKLLAKIRLNADTRFYQALYRILESNGTLRIEKDLDAGISQRQLRRLFEYYVGDTAKSFSKIVRFQHVLRASAQNLSDKKLFYDAGYYDQAHFIREFNHFYGITPGRTFGW
ncbi:MAG: helix-turn-helix domain-containing protein [Prolixibacteraceae bacterium]